MRDCPRCGGALYGPTIADVLTRSGDVVHRQVWECRTCRVDFIDVGQAWSLAEIQHRVRVVVAMDRRGELR